MTSVRRLLPLAGLTLTLVACGGHGGSSRGGSTVAGATSAPSTSSTPPPVIGPGTGPVTPPPTSSIALAAGPANPGPARLAPGVQAVALQASLRSPAAASVSEITVVAQGTGAGDLTQVTLVEDVDRNGRFDAARDRTLGSAAAAPFRVTTTLGLVAGQDALVLVLTGFRAGTAAGRTASLQVEARGVVASQTVQGGALGASLTVRGPATPGTWTQAAALPTPRLELAAASLPAGTVHATGGSVAGAATAVHEVYDPALDRWSTRAPLLVARSSHAAAELGGKLYVVGGQLGAAVLDSAEEWDPASDTWRAIASLPVALRDCAAVGYQGELWVVGAQRTTAWIWNPTTNAWRTGPGSGTPSRAVTVAAGWIVAFEETSQVYWGPGGPTSSLPSPGAFAQSATVLWDFARDGRAATIGGRAYLVGGQRNGAPVAELRSIDGSIIFAGGSPITHPSPSVARLGFAAAALGNRLWALGGTDAGGAPVATVEEWTQ